MYSRFCWYLKKKNFQTYFNPFKNNLFILLVRLYIFYSLWSFFMIIYFPYFLFTYLSILFYYYFTNGLKKCCKLCKIIFLTWIFIVFNSYLNEDFFHLLCFLLLFFFNFLIILTIKKIYSRNFNAKKFLNVATTDILLNKQKRFYFAVFSYFVPSSGYNLLLIYSK